MLATAAALIAAAPALAGVVDAPIPLLDGQQASAVFYVPGVHATPLDVLWAHGGNLDTAFTCTSLETQNTLTFTVELFDYTGDGPIPGQGSPPIWKLKPGETRTVCTEPIDGVHIYDGINPASYVYGGSARIVSTSPKITCDALLGHTVYDPDSEYPLGPTVNLRVIRNDQKGD